MKALRLLCAILFGVVLLSFPAIPQAPAPSPVLQAMREELERSMKVLKEKGDPAPYFISYMITEEVSMGVGSSFGALQFSGENRHRLLDVSVRVGDYHRDNTHRLRGEFTSPFSRPAAVPMDDDPTAIRNALWLETDRRYKAAVERFSKVKTSIAVKAAEEDTSDDFSREPPHQFTERPVLVTIDRAAWEKKIKTYSAIFRNYPRLLNGNAGLSVINTTRYFVSSDGSVIQTSQPHLRLSLSAQARGEDGMDLARYESFDAADPGGLPDDQTVVSAAEKIAKGVINLLEAPLIEPYTGPAILSGKATGVFFHEIFGHRIEGHRQKDEEFAQTFTKKVGEPILPEFLSVYDDPTLHDLGGVALKGHYLYDDEGVASTRVPLVEKGVLKGFLMSRSPVKGFPQSNAHGRKQPGFDVVSRQGNLIVESSRRVPHAQLRQMLINEAKRQNKPYGLLFDEIQGGFTFTGRGNPQAFKVLPLVVYRVYTDGRPDELLRGVDLAGTPLVTFSKIIATGDDLGVFNGYCGAESGSVPVSAAAPSILVSEIEIEKRAKTSERPPILPAPEVKQ